MTYVIQLIARELLAAVKACSKNDDFIHHWNENIIESALMKEVSEILNMISRSFISGRDSVHEQHLFYSCHSCPRTGLLVSLLIMGLMTISSVILLDSLIPALSITQSSKIFKRECLSEQINN